MIITTKNNNLSDDIENIILESFSKKEAILYLKKSLKNRLNKKDIDDKLVEGFGSNTMLHQLIGYLKQ
ncbi:NTPase [Rickettsia rhipicephali]|uniref:NTPase n=1 Tax=Rickettsia rhipicephali TaxID=33992 RepID=UPI002258C10E|nr:NTPase [Rickettsia rhipicephali]MCX4079184.1 NTPase [Rickettsia rhipicephali]